MLPRPDRAVVSTARRTRETWALLGFDVPAEFDRRLYYGGLDALLDVVHETAPEIGTLLLVGHNPTVHDALRHLLGERTPTGGVAPGTAAVLEVDGPWPHVTSARLLELHRPPTSG